MTAGTHPLCTTAGQVGTGARTKVISTQGLASMRDNIITIFGSRTFEALTQLDGETADGIAIEGCLGFAEALLCVVQPFRALTVPHFQVCVQLFIILWEDGRGPAILLPEQPPRGPAQGTGEASSLVTACC